MTVWILRSIGSTPGAAEGLIIASDSVRYIFSFIPSYSLAFSILGLINTQTKNNVCINNVDNTTLMEICTSISTVSNWLSNVFSWTKGALTSKSPPRWDPIGGQVNQKGYNQMVIRGGVYNRVFLLVNDILLHTGGTEKLSLEKRVSPLLAMKKLCVFWMTPTLFFFHRTPCKLRWPIHNPTLTWPAAVRNMYQNKLLLVKRWRLKYFVT